MRGRRRKVEEGKEGRERAGESKGERGRERGRER